MLLRFSCYALFLIVFFVVKALNVQEERYLNEVLQLIGSYQFEQAKLKLESFLRQHPEHSEGNALFGTLYLKSGRDYETAVIHFENAFRKSESLTFHSYANYIETLRLLQRYEKARSFGRHLIDDKIVDQSTVAGIVYLNLGVVERYLGNQQAAYDLFTTAIQCDSTLMNAWKNQIEILIDSGMFAVAEQRLREAIVQFPKSALFYGQLGIAFHHQKKLDEALQAYFIAESLDDTALFVKGNIAAAFQGLGRSADALAYYEKLLPLLPNDAGLRNNYGALLGTMNKKDEEAYWLKEALKLDPTLEHAMVNLAGHYQDKGLLHVAANYIHQAMNYTTKTKTLLQLRNALMLSPVSFSYRQMLAERYRLLDNLREIVLAPPSSKAELDTTLDRIHFYLSYQGFNDRKFHESIGEIYSIYLQDVNQTRSGLANAPLQRLLTTETKTPSGFSQVSTMRPPDSLAAVAAPTKVEASKPVQQRKARIGFISKFFGIFEPHGMLLDGVMKYLPRQQFEVICLFVARTDLKPPAPAITESCQERYEISLVYQHALEVLQKMPALDVLVFADVVSEPINHFLLFNRLAPIQMAFWGNPVTSGSPHIDYYLSAEIMEHPYRSRLTAKQDPYSEQVILFEGQGIWYFQPTDPEIELQKVNMSHLVGPVQDFTRADFGIPEEAFVFLLPQSVFKIHPLYDLVLGEILRRSPKHVHLVVTGGRQKRWTRIYLLRLVTAIGPEYLSRIHVIERVSSESFYNLLKIANVILHPFPFDGSRTSADSLLVNIPYVTLPTEYLKGRMGFTYLRTMNLPELVASTIEEYINISLQLVNDWQFYYQMQAQISQQLYLIWEDMSYPYQWMSLLQRLLDFPRMNYYHFLQTSKHLRTSMISDLVKSKQRESNAQLFDQAMNQTGKWQRMKAWQLDDKGRVIIESMLPRNSSQWPNLFQYWVDKELGGGSQQKEALMSRMISPEIEERYMNQEVIELPEEYLVRIKKIPNKYTNKNLNRSGTSSSAEENSSNNGEGEQKNKLNQAMKIPPVTITSTTTETSFSTSRSLLSRSTAATTINAGPLQPGDARITPSYSFAQGGSISTTSSQISTTSRANELERPTMITATTTTTTTSSYSSLINSPTVENLPKFKKIAFDLFSAVHHRGQQGATTTSSTSSSTPGSATNAKGTTTTAGPRSHAFSTSTATTTTTTTTTTSPPPKAKISLADDKTSPSSESTAKDNETARKYTTTANPIEKEEIPLRLQSFYQVFKQHQYQAAVEIAQQYLSNPIEKELLIQENVYGLLLLEVGLLYYLLGEYEVAYQYCKQTEQYLHQQQRHIPAFGITRGSGGRGGAGNLESSILYACLGMTSLYRPIDYSQKKELQLRISYLQTAYELHAMELVEMSSSSINTGSSSFSISLARPKRLHSKVFSLTQASIENSLIQSYHSFAQYEYCLPFLQQYYDFPPMEAEGGYVLLFATIDWTTPLAAKYLQAIEEKLIEQKSYYYHPNSTIPTVPLGRSRSGSLTAERRMFGPREYRSLLSQIQSFQEKGDHLLNAMIQCLQLHPSYQEKVRLIQSQLLGVISQINLHHPPSPASPSQASINTARPGVVLITQYYQHVDPQSSIQQDLHLALLKNLQNPFLEEIHLLTETLIQFHHHQFPNQQKLRQQVIGKRLSFQDAFQYANQYLTDRIVILANADIYFDQSLQFFYEQKPVESRASNNQDAALRFDTRSMSNDTIFTLLKWTDRPDVLGIRLRTDSQDAWIFQPPISSSVIAQVDFYLGLPRCDNRLIDILTTHHYRVINAPFQVHAIEIQQSPRVATSASSNSNSRSSGNQYVNSLYGMRNAVLGAGRNVLIRDYFEL